MTIENDVADLRLHLDGDSESFHVVGTDLEVGALGTLRIEQESIVTFRDNRFVVERGLLRFHGRDRVEAGLNILASTQRRDWQITLRVTGTTTEPQIVLTSDPPLEELDILMVLAVGMTRGEFAQAGGSYLLMEAISRGLDDRLSQAIPLFDEFRITTEYSSRWGRPVPRVYVGQQLVERLQLGASAGLSVDRDFDATLAYEWTDWLDIEAFYTNNPDSTYGDIGVDFEFHHQWGGGARGATRRERSDR